jgi:hypothetical protein
MTDFRSPEGREEEQEAYAPPMLESDNSAHGHRRS